uniref:DUF4410 domain-containing protein n=1 Tax=Phenylobacterium glaciei TaxID=2803784 RepID=A0A974S9G9_9CAUL|nr:hypothetical protein JKL49_06220 [Phenylobacterium glaciei]
MRWLLSLVAVLSVGLASCASRQTMIELQRPPLKSGLAFAVPPGHPFYQTVTIDYVTGMSQHSFLFAEANQRQFRPKLARMLEDSGMLAPTPIAARYGLQVAFVDLNGSSIGGAFESRSRAIYRIVERRSGRVAFQTTVDAGFSARFVGLNERDAVALVRPIFQGDPSTSSTSPTISPAAISRVATPNGRPWPVKATWRSAATAPAAASCAVSRPTSR